MQSTNSGRAAGKRGEWVEAKFLARAQECGLNVSRPWGASSRYDFAIELDGRFRRVQVKSTQFRDHDGYTCTLRSHHERYYNPQEIDFFAVYLVPEDIWYIIPAEVAGSHRGHFFLAPARTSNKYHAFKEAWHLLTAGTEAAQAQPNNSEPVPNLETADPDSGIDPDADPGRVAVLSGIAEAEADDDPVSRRMANSFDYVRRHFHPRRS